MGVEGLGADLPLPVWQYLAPDVKFTTTLYAGSVFVQVEDIDVRARLVALDDEATSAADRQVRLAVLRNDVARRMFSPYYASKCTCMYSVRTLYNPRPSLGPLAVPYENVWLRPLEDGNMPAIMTLGRCLLDLLFQERAVVKYYGAKSKHVEEYLTDMGNRVIYAKGEYELLRKNCYYSCRLYRGRGQFAWRPSLDGYPRESQPMDSPAYALFLEAERLRQAMLMPSGDAVPDLFLKGRVKSAAEAAKEIDDEELELVAVGDDRAAVGGGGGGGGGGGQGAAAGSKRGRPEDSEPEVYELDSDGEFVDGDPHVPRVEVKEEPGPGGCASAGASARGRGRGRAQGKRRRVRA